MTIPGFEDIDERLDEAIGDLLPVKSSYEPEPIELEDIEKLAIAQAFMGVVGDLTSTKSPGNLRDRVNERMVELYDETGAKSFDVKLRGEKVGTYSLTVSKPTESTSDVVLEVSSKDELKAWDGLREAAYEYALENLKEVAALHFERTGEVPNGCKATEVVRPGDPGGRVQRSTLRIDGEAVVHVMGGELGAAARLMLEGGDE